MHQADTLASELHRTSFDQMESARRKIGNWIAGVQCKIVDGRLWETLPQLRNGWKKEIKQSRGSMRRRQA